VSKPSGAVSHIFQLFVAVLSMLARGVVAPAAAVTVTRSAILLISFLVVHMLGNLSALGGSEYFNAYADKLAHTPFMQLIEA
jgi:hypothetical protein